MARAKIPNPLDRRHLVEQELAPEKALAIARAYLDAGRSLEAVDFLAKAGAAEPLAELRGQAIEEGDAFLLRAVAVAQEEPPGREDWQRLAERAESRGLAGYASEARRQAERGGE